MIEYFYIQTIRIPAYGLLVLMGTVVCCYIALWITKKKEYQISEVMILGIVGVIGAILGAKLLALFTILLREGKSHLSWNTSSEAGYSYYGGLFGFFTFCFMYIKLKKIEYEEYAKSYIFLLPLLHCFWKVGCFMGGCCFGIPYMGPGKVIFPENVNALSGTCVFPVQLLESIVSFLIAVIIIVLEKKDKLYWPVSTYLIMYGATRFAIEFLRYHYGTKIEISYICSIISVVVGLIAISIKRRQVGIDI